jgi:hypothetical protein
LWISGLWGPDVTALIELAMGLALGLGAILARMGRYRAHAWCQAAVVLLNLGVVTTSMVPVFHRQVAVALSAGSLSTHYLLAAVHGAVGAMAELFAVYVLLVAGTSLVPHRLRFAAYKPWMRRALGLWWLVLLLGLAVYVS